MAINDKPAMKKAAKPLVLDIKVKRSQATDERSQPNACLSKDNVSGCLRRLDSRVVKKNTDANNAPCQAKSESIDGDALDYVDFRHL